MFDRKNHIQLVKKHTETTKQYVVGDVHGSDKMMEQIIEEIGPNGELYMVGDIVDRGSDSKRTLDLVIECSANR